MERFGFIHDKLDIKILILFILARLDAGISMEMLTELTLCDDGISYFDFSECVKELEESGHIVQKDHLFSITEKGKQNGKTTENSLPYSVRKRAEENTVQLTKRSARDGMICAEMMQKEGGGYTVLCTLNDGLGEILNLSIFAASEEQAKSMVKNFSSDAERMYGEMVALFAGDTS